MPADLDELAALADRMENTGLILLVPLIRAAIAELRSLRSRPAVPPWTKERPTEPGLYVVRHDSVQSDGSRGSWFSLGEVARDSLDRPVVLVYGLNIGPFDAGLSWFGPLPMPPEPDPEEAADG